MSIGHSNVHSSCGRTEMSIGHSSVYSSSGRTEMSIGHSNVHSSRGQTEISIGHSNVHSSSGRTELSIGHKYMSIRPLDEHKCPLDNQTFIRPMDEWTLSDGKHFSLLSTCSLTRPDYVITASLAL